MTITIRHTVPTVNFFSSSTNLRSPVSILFKLISTLTITIKNNYLYFICIKSLFSLFTFSTNSFVCNKSSISINFNRRQNGFFVNQFFFATVHQINDFFQALGSQLPQNFPIETKSIIRSIITTSFRPAIIRHTTRITGNSLVEPPLFPPECIIDRIRFRVEVNRFKKIIIAYRTNQHYLNWVSNNFNQITITAIITSRAGTVILEKLYIIGNIPEPLQTPRSFKSTSLQDVSGKNLFLFLKQTLRIFRQLNQITRPRTVILTILLFSRHPKHFRFPQACRRGKIQVSRKSNEMFPKFS